MSSETEFKMNRFDNRVKSFKDWPFDNNLSTCTSSKMALAGFFHTPTETEPDLVKCFVCLKELDGWESEDDPWSEHKRHMPKCSFIKLNKKEEDWKIEDIVKLEVQRQRAIVKKHLEQKIEEFRHEASTIREKLEEL